MHACLVCTALRRPHVACTALLYPCCPAVLLSCFPIVLLSCVDISVRTAGKYCCHLLAGCVCVDVDVGVGADVDVGVGVGVGVGPGASTTIGGLAGTSSGSLMVNDTGWGRYRRATMVLTLGIPKTSLTASRRRMYARVATAEQSHTVTIPVASQLTTAQYVYTGGLVPNQPPRGG